MQRFQLVALKDISTINEAAKSIEWGVHLLSCRAADNKLCADNTLVDLVCGKYAFNLIDKESGSFATYFLPQLVDGSKLRVRGFGTETIAEAAYRDILRHTQSAALHRAEYSDGSVVVNGEEGIGPFRSKHKLGRDALSVLAVVADTHDMLVYRQAVLQLGVLVAVVTILGYLHVHWRTEECYPAAARADEMLDGIESSLIVIDDDTRRVDTVTDTVVEDYRQTALLKLAEVVILLRILCQRDDDAAHARFVERLTQFYLALKILMALAHENAVATPTRFILDTVKHRSEVVMNYLRQNQTYQADRLRLGIAKVFCQDVRREIMLAGVRLYHLATLTRYGRRVVQCSRDGRHGYSKVAGDIFHRYGLLLIHSAYCRMAVKDCYRALLLRLCNDDAKVTFCKRKQHFR